MIRTSLVIGPVLLKNDRIRHATSGERVKDNGERASGCAASDTHLRLRARRLRVPQPGDIWNLSYGSKEDGADFRCVSLFSSGSSLSESGTGYAPCTSPYILVLVLKSVMMLCSECHQKFSGGEPCRRRQTSTLQSKSPDDDLTRSLAQMVPLTASRPSGRNEWCKGACERAG